MKTSEAPLLWHYLNGIVCVYKPPTLSWLGVRRTLLNNLAKELNALKCRPTRSYVDIMGDTTKPLNVEVRTNYADHPLVVGPRYIPQDIKAHFVHPMSSLMSGVTVIGINQSAYKAGYIRSCNPLCTYRITGQLGIQTNNKAWTGNTLYRCSFRHIKKHNIDKAVSVIESTSQKSLFTLMKIHPQSQEAYELISKGLFRPIDSSWPVIYSIKCVNFDSPYFTLEVVAINERENHLLNIVDEIGSRLQNAAISTSIQCIRCAYFTLEDALLKKHWTLQNVINNMAHCEKILANNKDFTEFFQERKREEEKLSVENVDDMSKDEEEIEDTRNKAYEKRN